MSIRVNINHFTRYRYDRHVTVAPQLVRLRPAPHCRTPVLAYSLRIQPDNHFINWQQDPFGNYLARLVLPEKTHELSIEVDVVVDMTTINPFDFFLEGYAEEYPFVYNERLASELTPYLEVRERGELLTRWLAGIDRSVPRTVDFLVAMNQRLQRDIGYVVRMAPGIQTCEQTLSLARGSCRDTAWLLVQILRHLGLAARFVSGYLVQLTADVKALDGPTGPERDFTDLHAWAEVYLPGAGWIGLDPTSGLIAGEGHIPLACAPHPQSAAPISGATEECKTDLYFHNRVRRSHETPRVTKPYSEDQWRSIDELGRRVDADLHARDVRLTMGGEPTFVSVDDMEGAQWTTDALGVTKRSLAAKLLQSLKQTFAPGGVLQFGQGKWYPGEPLPRWALGCFWRRDGVPLWTDEALLSEEKRITGLDVTHASRFIATLAHQLCLAPDLVISGYEDFLYYMWKEGTLPVNIDPLRFDLDDAEERSRLSSLLRRGLDRVVGYALPLKWQEEASGGPWRSSHWKFRAQRMHLLPGSSPMGYRLPLDSLPWVATKDREVEYERDQFGAWPPLGNDAARAQRPAQQIVEPRAPHVAGPVHGQKPQDAAEDECADIVHTALCVEPRDGVLHVFLPPVTHLEHYVELLAHIEATAKRLSMPIALEGYEPPRDPRLQRLLITPDPGVIEVNVQPSSSWEDLSHLTETLYEEARLTRLGTEKFMLDGRHTGTGGGNHVTIGGPTPADSPVLRRPDLLRSLVTYWQHHPSLSYLFSGLFVGPTSQAPRVDEARDDSLYEIEIAFQQMPDGEVPQPWLVDRLLRNLLTDVTGNTHRAEFCLDKLYSPEGPAGRLGLVEMRAFEMPPHPRMSLVQMLLLRALIAHFWTTPYRREPVRWNTELHDRFMLPHYLWEDLREVVRHLQQAGYDFHLDWFAPFLEFRFPPYGSVQIGQMKLELRMAVEPWHVLGEEIGSTGTARYVDSSVERLQVKVDGLVPERYVVTCNGRRIPLRATARRAESVAGVRYRAWQPPSALHPTIPVHAPLVFDVVDLWDGYSIGGCTYHVVHPGGRNYEVFPVNAMEAEARRVARFWPYGHTPGPMAAPPEERSPEFPHTLDLRRADV